MNLGGNTNTETTAVTFCVNNGISSIIYLYIPDADINTDTHRYPCVCVCVKHLFKQFFLSVALPGLSFVYYKFECKLFWIHILQLSSLTQRRVLLIAVSFDKPEVFNINV